MAWFEAFRNQYGFASYKDNRTPVTFDIPLLTVTYLCVLVSIATLIATLGIRGRERWSFTIRAAYAVSIGSIILACLVGYDWQEGSAAVKSHYVYRNNLPFEGRVGVRVSLTTVNVTLDGHYRGSSGPGYVYYAESLHWSDFGVQSEQYSYFLHKGLPAPILRVMEFLTVDEGGLRWGRSFHVSGYFAMSLLWTSFAFWIVTNVLLFSVVVYGAYMFTLTGVTMILSCVAYHVTQCPLPLVVNFGAENLRVSYSWCYWLTLAAGSLTFLLGLLLIVIDGLAHAGVSEFFHLDNLADDRNIENELNPNDTEKDNNIMIDRRGAVMPPLSEKRGSIFLDSCRTPSLPADMKKFNFSSASNVTNGMFNDICGGHSKINPIYTTGGMKNSCKSELDEEEVRVQMERVCEDLEVCMSTKKPSLATLKEHRENHANERLNSSTGKATNRYVRKHDRRASQARIVTLNSMLRPDQRRGSCSDIVSTGHSFERFISENPEFHAKEHCQSSPPDEVAVSIEFEQNSPEDSTSTRSSFVENSLRGSDEGIHFCARENNADQKNNSQNSEIENEDVFVIVGHQ